MPRWLDALAFDIRYAARGLCRSPGFTAAAVLAFAIGIGACTAVFSVVDLILFRALPYPQADRLVSLGFSAPLDANEFNIGSSYLDWRQQQTAFQSITSMFPGAPCDLAGQTPMRIRCQPVEASFLATLGIEPIAGRDFTPEEDVPSAPRVALLTYPLWKSRFSGDRQVIGTTIEIDGGFVRVAGVLPATFEMPQLGEADVLLPQQMDQRAARAPNATIFLRTFARLKEGIGIEAARQRMMPLFEESLRKDVPPRLRKEVHLVVRSLRDRQMHDATLSSWLLFGGVLALLALACANVANLLLARAAARRGEFAVRSALGAARRQLLGQTFTESMILSLVGGVAGCIFAALLIRAFVAISPQGMVRLSQARIDLRVLLFALGCSVLSALISGLLPAWQRLSTDALTGARTSLRVRSRQALVAAQIALSLVLLSGASLLVRSLWNLQTAPLGFRPERIVTASFTLNREHYRTNVQQGAFYSELERQLAGIPGVSHFALSDSMPPAGAVHARPFSNIRIVGRPPLPENGGMVAFRYVTPGYFRALGIPVLAGRDFDESERSAADTPVILSATLTRRIFGNDNPIGQQVDLDGEGHVLPIVGVAADVKNSGLAETPEPEYYRLRPYSAARLGLSAVAFLDTSLDEGTAARWIRQQIAAIDQNLPVNIERMEQRVNTLSARQRFLAALIGLFSGFGLLLAAIGLYGVLSFLVAQRTREIGIRMAVGAQRGNIAAMMGRQAGWWIAIGIVAGGAASFALGRWARGLLFQVSPYDSASFASAVGILVAVAALAAALPALRAARVEPAVSLRQD